MKLQVKKFVRMHGEPRSCRTLLEFLEHRGVRPGAKLRLLERNYDQTLTLSTPAGTVSLGPAASERVWLAPAVRPKR